jgi:ankyrin repeat protein
MALERGEATTSTPAPRALIVANLISIAFGILVAAFVFPIYFREREAQFTQRQAIMAATQRGDAAELRAVLENIKPQDRDLGWALTTAAESGYEEAVAVLLEYGASSEVITTYRRTTPLLAAIRGGHMGIAKRLLNAGAGVNFPDRGGATPLHEASETGSIQAISLLLQHGANLNARNGFGQAPAEVAEQAGHRAAVRLLRVYAGKPQPPELNK